MSETQKPNEAHEQAQQVAEPNQTASIPVSEAPKNATQQTPVTPPPQPTPPPQEPQKSAIIPFEGSDTSVSMFNSSSGFAHVQRVATALASSTMVPADYRGNIPNCIVAIEMAERMGISPMMVMQNMNVIHGRPSWSSAFIISGINTCGKFTGLRFKTDGTGVNKQCMAWSRDAKTNELLEGPAFSVAMAQAEGYYDKKGSKWPTFEHSMLCYRAAALFGRLYCPEVMMGMHTTEEVQDIIYQDLSTPAPAPTGSPIDAINNTVRAEKAETPPKASTPHSETANSGNVIEDAVIIEETPTQSDTSEGQETESLV